MKRKIIWAVLALVLLILLIFAVFFGGDFLRGALDEETASFTV